MEQSFPNLLTREGDSEKQPDSQTEWNGFPKPLNLQPLYKGQNPPRAWLLFEGSTVYLSLTS